MSFRPLLSGPAFEVSAYARDDDSCQVAAHLDGLGARDRKRVAALLKRMADQGPPRNHEQCRKVAGEAFWELKAYQQRIFWCYDPTRRDDELSMLRGFAKKSARTPKKELVAGRQAYRAAQQDLSLIQGSKERMIDNWIRQYEGDPEFEFDLLAIDIGERIVERMEQLSMTRTELAGKIGVSKARISQILSGNDNLTLKEPCGGCQWAGEPDRASFEEQGDRQVILTF